MRPPFLTVSVLVHGGAIGAVIAFGASAHEARRTPRVEIVSTVASTPSADRVPTPVDTAPAMLPEDSPLWPELPADPVFADPELFVEVSYDPPPMSRSVMRVSLARIKPVEPPPEPPPVAVEPEVVPPVEPPAPESVRVAASPRSDNRPPSYPNHERALGREGTVLVTAKIDRFGLVVDVALAEPSRYAGFNRAALAAVRSWRFTPASRGGVPVQDEVDVPVIFRIADAQ